MKHLTVVALLCVWPCLANAQAPSQETLNANLEKKLKSAFLSKAAWHTDFDKTCEASKESGKPVFAYFTRSYSP